MRTCSVKGCESPVQSRGWCRLHYKRWARNGDPLRLVERGQKVCSIDGCESPHLARGWCRMHYKRWDEHGDPLHEREARACSVEGCDEPHLARGLCSLHWQRMARTGTTDPPQRIPECVINECKRPVHSYGLCKMHDKRLKRLGDPEAPVRSFGSGDNIEYMSAHQRVYVRRGSASAYPCVDCGKQAHDWSYVHDSPRERIQPSGPAKGLAYSPDPDDYEPRCKRCHVRYDRAPAPD